MKTPAELELWNIGMLGIGTSFHYSIIPVSYFLFFAFGPNGSG
jgi:hypothetical protein